MINITWPWANNFAISLDLLGGPKENLDSTLGYSYLADWQSMCEMQEWANKSLPHHKLL